VKNETVLVIGSTGLVGIHLIPLLKNKGYNVHAVNRLYSVYPFATNDLIAFEKQQILAADIIINLAGANISAKRWTKNRKQLIVDSRVNTTQMIHEIVMNHDEKRLKAYISASAVGYYGSNPIEKVFVETDSPAFDFLGETCYKWEESANLFSKIGIRTVKIRTGVVLSSRGGALPKMVVPVKFGFGSAIGSGRQFVPWIHIDDLCNIYIMAIEHANINGAYNAVAPQYSTNKEFMSLIAKVLKKPFWRLNIPSLLMKAIFGEMSVVLLAGNRVSSEKIRKAGYNFLFPDLFVAFNDLLKN